MYDYGCYIPFFFAFTDGNLIAFPKMDSAETLVGVQS
jgi:hypothetical protein